jgi:hypothetical protein
MAMATQTEQIRAHLLEHNAITPLEALDKYGCFRLAARIKELRNAGFSVHSTIVKNNGKRYCRYVMG